ncbi:unnamed protein product [Dicrocoelium dendriticum]|nr:unnamed protein product [Dicrocoelium dendriticum]
MTEQRSLSREVMAPAITAFNDSKLKRTTQSAIPLEVPKMTERSNSSISASMIARLHELRSKFAERTETIRAKTLQKTFSCESDNEEHASQTEETTEPLKTEDNRVQFNAQLGDAGSPEKKGTWRKRYPGRKLVLRRPFCTACLAPHRKHFVVIAKKPLIKIETFSRKEHDGIKPEVSEATVMEEIPEIIGQDFVEMKEYQLSIPAWIPDPKAVLLMCFSPHDTFYLVWLLGLMLAVLYNYITIPLREAFDIYDNEKYRVYWYFGNAAADVLYLVDLLIVKPRLEFLDQGIIVSEYKLCFRNYLKSRQFVIKAFWDAFERLDQRLSAAYTVRLARTLIYMMYIIHVEACWYYGLNRIKGIGATSWSIPLGNISPYVYSFYICMKTATSIGSLPAATTPTEYIFMTSYWLSGTFVSAILIGQVIDILDAANANKMNYRRIMDSTLSCMHHLRAPVHVVNKVRTWFVYNWEQQKTFDENSLFEVLPIKLKRDLAISVHFQTLSKVSLFQNCERALIYDMVLKLKPVVFLPMDYICRKGEVGKEMYIVKSGTAEVVGGENNSTVFGTLKEGSVFGEISLLALSGKNRRTADVRSKGFSTLFSLSKEDFEEIMKNYPQAHAILRKRSR